MKKNLIILVESNLEPCFLVCDRTTEINAFEIMEKHQKKHFTVLSIGKLRRSTSVDISDLLEDDGKGDLKISI